jgi:hypothetical protein
LRLVSIQSDELEELMRGVAANLGCNYAPLAEIVRVECPLPPDEAATRPGDIWVLGDHRLMCGDSSKPADVDRLQACSRASEVFIGAFACLQRNCPHSANYAALLGTFAACHIRIHKIVTDTLLRRWQLADC